MKRYLCYYMLTLLIFLYPSSAAARPLELKITAIPEVYLADSETQVEKKLMTITGFENKGTESAERLWDTSTQRFIVNYNYSKNTSKRRMKMPAKKIISLVIFFVLGVSFFAGGTSEKAPKTTKITVKGEAKIPEGNVDKAKLIALRDAYTQAVQHCCDFNIEALNHYRGIKQISKIVESRSRGFIREYTITKEGVSKTDPEKYEVLIEALVVDDGKVGIEEKEGLKKYLELLPKPKILLVIREKEEVHGIIDPKKDNGRSRIRSIDTALAHSLSEYGYEVITLNDPEVRQSGSQNDIEAVKFQKFLRLENALKLLARRVESDMALIGETIFCQKGKEKSGGKQVTLTAESSARALLVSSEKFIDVFHSTEQVSHSKRFQAFSDCVDKINDKMAKELAWKIQRILGGEYRQIGLKITGISRSQAVKIEQQLTRDSEIEKVATVELPTEENDSASFTIFTGFIPLEAWDISEKCSRVLDTRLKLVSSNKFEIVLSLR